MSDFVLQVLSALQIVERELLLFAAFWFVVSAVDEFAVDLGWLWLRLSGRARDVALAPGIEAEPLQGRIAVFVPAWHEAEVISHTVRHMLRAWSQDRFTVYVGCYANDSATVAAAMAGSDTDARIRLVIHDRAGPTTKADCLNRLYAAMGADEARTGRAFTSVVLHDAEDMVHPAALVAIDRGLADSDFVQLPVRPEPQPASPWIAGHYADEFTEAHAKSLVLRGAVGAAIPAAGVGCGFSRLALAGLAARRMGAGQAGPFEAECLTEDYELGLTFSRGTAKGRFLQLRDSGGELVATRSFFPATLEEAVRQKTRWIHGIALQGWDRLGWTGRAVDVWMALRDRRGPLTAIVLAAAYLLLVIEGVLLAARAAGWDGVQPLSPALKIMLVVSFSSFLWRAAWRYAFTAREYGVAEGIRSVLRIPVANVIAIMAGRRAMFSYARTLRGQQLSWDKTAHASHPSITARRAIAR